MTNVGEQLNQVWSEFRKAGVTDDLTVIEYIARFLLEESDLTVVSKDSTITSDVPNDIEKFPSENDTPRRPPKDLNIDIESIKQHLREASEQAGGSATLFDCYVLFRLPSMLPPPKPHNQPMKMNKHETQHCPVQIQRGKTFAFQQRLIEAFARFLLWLKVGKIKT